MRAKMFNCYKVEKEKKPDIILQRTLLFCSICPFSWNCHWRLMMMLIFIYLPCVIMSKLQKCQTELKRLFLGWILVNLSTCKLLLSEYAEMTHCNHLSGDFSDYSGLQRWACNSWGWAETEAHGNVKRSLTISLTFFLFSSV